MSDCLECPHCDEREFDPDWLYNNDMYNPNETKEIKCPSCHEKFWVSIWPSIGYTSAKDKDDLP